MLVLLVLLLASPALRAVPVSDLSMEGPWLPHSKLALAEPESALVRTSSPAMRHGSDDNTPRIAQRPPRRVVAIGDVHADLQAFVAALQVAGLVDAALDWAGGNAVAVQLGDQLDRGTDEAAVLNLTARLKRQAHLAGGLHAPL